MGAEKVLTPPTRALLGLLVFALSGCNEAPQTPTPEDSGANLVMEPDPSLCHECPFSTRNEPLEGRLVRNGLALGNIRSDEHRSVQFIPSSYQGRLFLETFDDIVGRDVFTFVPDDTRCPGCSTRRGEEAYHSGLQWAIETRAEARLEQAPKLSPVAPDEVTGITYLPERGCFFLLPTTGCYLLGELPALAPELPRQAASSDDLTFALAHSLHDSAAPEQSVFVGSEHAVQPACERIVAPLDPKVLAAYTLPDPSTIESVRFDDTELTYFAVESDRERANTIRAYRYTWTFGEHRWTFEKTAARSPTKTYEFGPTNAPLARLVFEGQRRGTLELLDAGKDLGNLERQWKAISEQEVVHYDWHEGRARVRRSARRGERNYPHGAAQALAQQAGLRVRAVSR